MKTAAIYARVSGDQQRQEQTIASQTAALIEFAGTSDYRVPAEWVIEDDGFSGAELIRPGLERVRDLAAEGAIEAVLVYSPDRLCREYVHQMLLIEEFCRAGVEVLFVQAPRAQTPEDRLLLQFQGMFAEYERAQILERSRRGKLHRARQGQINVLSGAPYGFLYVRRSDAEPARYEVLDAEAAVVRAVYAWYTVDGLSIGAITARLNQRGGPRRISTRGAQVAQVPHPATGDQRESPKERRTRHKSEQNKEGPHGRTKRQPAPTVGRGDQKTRELHLCVRAMWHEGLTLEIQDDGVGLPASLNGDGQGLELHSTMMAVVGGALTMERASGKTVVRLALPMTAWT